MQPTQDLQPGIASNISHEPLQPSIDFNSNPTQDLQPGVDNTSGTDATEPTYIINIHNYRNIKSINLPLHSGVTALTGKSNAGKSSIINATKGLLYNQIRKTDINQNTNQPLQVCLSKPQSDKQITFSLTQSQNEYHISSPTITTTLQKNGTSTPPEIVQVYHISPDYNFWSQMTPPFLTSYSPQDLYQTLNQNQTTSKLTNIINQIKQDQKLTKQQIDSNTTINQQLQLTNTTIQSKLQIINQIPQLNPQLPHNFQVYQNLTNLISTQQNLQQQINHLQHYPHLNLQFTTPLDQFTPLNTHNNLLTQISNLQSKLQQTQEQTKQYHNLLNHFTTCPLCNQPLDNHNTY